MRWQLCWTSLLCLLAAISLTPLTDAAPQKSELAISLNEIHIHSNERIVGFELHLKSARIVSMPKIPIGWSFSVDNDPSWNTAVQGNILVGSAALDSGFFRRFLLIERDDSAI